MFKVFISMVLQAWTLNRITEENSIIGALDPLKNDGHVFLLSKHIGLNKLASSRRSTQGILSNIILISKLYGSNVKYM